MRFALLGIALLLLAALAGCGGSSGQSAPTPSPSPTPAPQSITVVPVEPTIANGTTQQLVAIAHFANHTSAVVTRAVNWTSSSSGIASVGNTIGNKGLVSGASAGQAVVTAELSGVSSSTGVTVTNATLVSVTVIPPVLGLPEGASVDLSAIANFSDGTTQDLTTSAFWHSSNLGIAHVGNTEVDKGHLTANATGTASITAELIGMAGSAAVTVRDPTLTSIVVEPPNTSMVEGATQQLIAIGNYSDESTANLTQTVKWKSSEPNIAQVGKNKGEEGLVTAKKPGSTTITAMQDGATGLASVVVAPPTLTSISVTPPKNLVASGTSTQLTATGVLSDGSTEDLTRTASWISSAPVIAVVSGAPGSQGQVTGTAVGSATITASQEGVSGTSSVIVTPPALDSISITPSFVSIANGISQQLTATGNFSDGSTQDLTNSASWVSLSPRVAEVSSAPGSKGLVTGLAVGGATIRVTQAGVSDTTTVVVTPAILTAISITPVNPSIAKGTLGRLVATGIFSDHTTQNLTRSVSWTSSSRTVAIAGNHFPFQGAVFGRGEGSATITASQGGVSGTAALTVTPATLASITVTPPHPSIANGTSLQLTATGTFSDRTTQNLTASVSWTSSDPQDAVVSNAEGSQGLVTGTGVGSARITATQGGVSGTASVTVTPATLSSITITPPNPAIAKGTTKQLTATGTFTDGSTQDLTSEVSWTSSDQTIAEVDNALRNQGLVSGIAVGTATISAREDGITGTTAVTVTPAALTSITITPPNPSVAKGTSQQLNASGAFTDGTVQDLTRFVSWISSDLSIAQVSSAQGSQGVVTGIATGAATITASLNGISGTTSVTVTPATLISITITPPDSSIAKGTTVQLNATCNLSDGTTQDCTTQASWSSADNTIAQVSNAQGTQGLATGIGTGNASITATLNGIQGSTTVTVTPATLSSITITPPDSSIAKGTTVLLSATCNLSDGTSNDCTTQASWTSADNAVAQVSNTSGTEGLVTGIGQGNTSITATVLGVQGSTTVTVTAATPSSITITPSDPTIANGTTVLLSATCNLSDGSTQDCTTQVSWTSANNTIAQVSNAPETEGLVTGIGKGNTSVTATVLGIQGSTTVTVTAANLTSITVDPVAPSIAKGTTIQLNATCAFSDGTTLSCTKVVSWTSANNSIAEVSNTVGTIGLVTGVGTGNTPITATFNAAQGSATVTVTPATLNSITVTPPDSSIAKGTTVPLIATCNLSDGSTQDCTTQVSWTSANSTIAQVSNDSGTEGLVTGIGKGNTSITATVLGLQGSSTVTVTAATLSSITITPPDSSIAKGTTVQLSATCNLSDGTTQRCTGVVSWTSSSGGIAEVSNSSPTKGLVAGTGVGNATISGSFGGMQGSATVSVTAATLSSITITPPDTSIAKGTTAQLNATCNLSDGTTQDCTTQVSWTSADNTIAQVSNAQETQGLATGIGAGNTSITATGQGIQGSTTVTVTAAVLTAIQVTPPNPSIAKGTSLQMTATGILSDGTTQDLTNLVSWSVSPPSLATVDPNGLLTAVGGPGQGLVRASFVQNGLTLQGTTHLTVTAASVTAIQVSPPNPSIAKGTTLQMTATGILSDGTTQVLTNLVSWSVSPPSLATVDPNGLLTAVSGPGQGLVRASFIQNGLIIQGTTHLTVTPAVVTAIQVTPPDPSIAKGTTEQLNATCNLSDGTTQSCTTQVSWTSSDQTIAQVDNAPNNQGLVSGIGRGTATITAEHAGVTGTTAVTVTPAVLTSIVITPPKPSVPKGTSQQLSAFGTFSDETVQDLTPFVSWVSSDLAIAQVSSAAGSKGVVTGIATGVANISATFGGTSGTTPVTVTPATLTSITITPPRPVIVSGTSVQMTATGTFSDGTTEDLTGSPNLSWSTTGSVATISPAGLLTGVSAGVGTVSALVVLPGGNVQGTTALKVTPALLTSIAITPANPSLAVGITLQLTATGTFSNGTTQDLTKSVSWDGPAGVVTIDPDGLMTATSVGSGSISAQQSGIVGTTTVTVTPATLTSISLTPTNPTIANGTGVLLAATCHVSDGTTQDCTNQANWVSSSTATAVVTNVDGFKGLVLALAPGSVTITATVNGVGGSTPVTITNATLNSITLTPANPTVTAGFVILMKATGSFSDGTTQDLTPVADWTSSNLSVAQVFTNSVSSNGITLTFQAGTATITATLLGVQGSTLVTVQ